MNLGDFIKSKLEAWSVDYSTELIEAELLLLGLDPQSNIEDVELNGINRLFYNLIPSILACPNSISEGGFSVQFNKNELKDYYGKLASELGLPNIYKVSPKIKNASNKW